MIVIRALVLIHGGAMPAILFQVRRLGNLSACLAPQLSWVELWIADQIDKIFVRVGRRLEHRLRIQAMANSAKARRVERHLSLNHSLRLP
jgi:hypothetical protein